MPNHLNAFQHPRLDVSGTSPAARVTLLPQTLLFYGLVVSPHSHLPLRFLSTLVSPSPVPAPTVLRDKSHHLFQAKSLKMAPQPLSCLTH